MGDYHKAPSTLYNLEGVAKRCKTQEELDQAWRDGWFGPVNMIQKKLLLSEAQNVDWETKGELKVLVEMDPRYEGLRVNTKDTVEEIVAKVAEFEEENDIASIKALPPEDDGPEDEED